jgi:trans-aconitate methyltransferase
VPDPSYDGFAPAYDKHFRRPVDRMEDDYLTCLLDPSVTGRDVIDLGCGTGWVLDHLAPRSYTGVDCSMPMLEELVRKHPDAATVHAKVGDQWAWTNELPRRPVDTVVATWALEYLGDLARLLIVCAGLVNGPEPVLALHGTLPHGHRRAHFSVKDVPYQPLSPLALRKASEVAGLPKPRVYGTSGWPDRLPLTVRRFGWGVTLPASWQYSALWVWRL